MSTPFQIGLFQEGDPAAPQPEDQYGAFTLPRFHDLVDWLDDNCYILQPRLAKTLFSIFSCNDRIHDALLFWKVTGSQRVMASVYHICVLYPIQGYRGIRLALGDQWYLASRHHQNGAPSTCITNMDNDGNTHV